MAKNVIDVTIGKIKNGSEVVRSTNHINPPLAMLSTGRFDICLKPAKTDKNIGSCKINHQKQVNGSLLLRNLSKCINMSQVKRKEIINFRHNAFYNNMTSNLAV